MRSVTVRQEPSTPDRPPLLLWTLWAAAAALFSLAVYAEVRAPSIGLNWKGDGEIVDVVPAGAADRAGIMAGDHLIAIGGERADESFSLLYAARAGQPLSVEVESGGELRNIELRAQTRVGERLEAASSGGPNLIRVASWCTRLVVNAWVLAMSAALLYLRPRLHAARVAAVALAFWAGGNELVMIPGIGSLLEDLPRALTGLLFSVDLLFLCSFFAPMVHFGLVFPDRLPFVARNRNWELAPYALVAPLAGLALWNLAIFYRLLPAQTISFRLRPLFEIYGPSLLLAEVAALAFQFRYTSDVTDRRRLKLVLLACVPGVASWIVALGADRFATSTLIRASAAALQWFGAGAGAGIFTYAIVRHRLFDIRPLVRKSVQHAFARGTLLFGVSLPAFALMLFLYVNRRRSLEDLLTTRFLALLAILIPFAFLLRNRQRLLDALDRRFFREEYDARHALLRVVSMIQRGTDIIVLGKVALIEIEKALHPVHLSLWLLDSAERNFQRVLNNGIDPPAPPLDRRSALVKLIGVRDETFDTITHGSVRKLTPEEQAWLQTTGARLLVPLTVDHDVMGFLLLGERLSEEPYSAEDRHLLRLLASQLALTEDYGRLEILARKDPLTEALNRHAFYSLLEKKRVFPFQATSGCVAVLDLNDLKVINDSYGHAAGDLAIRRVAAAIRSVVRADDLVFRWGGDEFLVVLFGMNADDTRERLGRLEAYLDTAAPDAATHLAITVSFGLACFDEITFIHAAIEEADGAMYAQKQTRKNVRMRDD